MCREIETGVLLNAGHVDQLLGEASCGVEIRLHIVKKPQTMQHREMLWRVSQFLAQLQRSTICNLHVRGGVAFGGNQRGACCRQQLQFAPGAFGAYRHGAKNRQSL